jgi:hypothetical protein
LRFKAFSNFFNTLSDRLVQNDPAFFVYFNLKSTVRFVILKYELVGVNYLEVPGGAAAVVWGERRALPRQSPQIHRGAMAVVFIAGNPIKKAEPFDPAFCFEF